MYTSYIDSYLHTHFGKYSTVNLDTQYNGNHLINIHSVYMFNNFKNISSELGNNVFFYDIGQSIIIPDGNYSIISFNKYINSLGITQLNLTRIVNSYDGLKYQVV